MIIREAQLKDIPQIQIVRNSVKENILSDPNLVTDKDCEEFLFERGKGWVCEIKDKIVGFSIADLKENNIWALFLHPDFEGQGIGKKLHDVMLKWYFGQTHENVWLGTSPHTRAENFYRKSGWKEIGTHGKGEIKFEMPYQNWKQIIMKNNIKSIRPFIGSENFEESRNFYRDLGFEEVVLDPKLSLFKRQEISFYLQDAYVKEWIENTMLFIEVENTDEVYRELADLNFTEKYKTTKLSPIRIMDWGKECFVHDPAGVLWHFGEFLTNKL
ncbi:GNAT family N-acetyltransferase [Chryseobacterium daeguense]|uniref:GNAT family N-acetyltransferase n=1 Tax=Chryseobacterium daeguense TaxID=412438 RepID=UPI00042167E4|nr:GNAT family N-acetyltransferase [Chryseobacterium daeguense]